MRSCGGDAAEEVRCVEDEDEDEDEAEAEAEADVVVEAPVEEVFQRGRTPSMPQDSPSPSSYAIPSRTISSPTTSWPTRMVATHAYSGCAGARAVALVKAVPLARPLQRACWCTSCGAWHD